LKASRFLAFAVMAAFMGSAMQPAQAQSADTWKSVAIIGGSTAVGAYVGHKIAGRTGAYVGAAVGASTGYAIDRRRRANESYSQYGYSYGDGGYYGNYGPYDPNAGNYGGPYSGPYGGDAYPYPSGYQSNSFSSSRRASGRR
jgi:hypothetical protein